MGSCCKMSLKNLVKNDSLGLGWVTGLGLGWLTWSRSRYTSGLGLGKEILVSVDPCYRSGIRDRPSPIPNLNGTGPGPDQTKLERDRDQASIIPNACQKLDFFADFSFSQRYTGSKIFIPEPEPKPDPIRKYRYRNRIQISKIPEPKPEPDPRFYTGTETGTGTGSKKNR